MKKMNKVIALVLALGTVMSLGACGTTLGTSGGEKRDPTKTYLSVYNFDGGIGTQWAYDAADRFEELYKDKSFEEGKTGVQVEVFPGKSAVDSLLNQPYDVFFTESVFYNDLILQDAILDITDIVQAPLTDVRGCTETGSIEDKLYEEHLKALPAMNGKYYVIPHYECYSGVSYDRDLFDSKSLFIKEGTGETQFTNLSGQLSVGPDGIRGNYDDGLPSSYEEFYNLLNRMVKKNVEPFIYTGKFKTYSNHLISGLWAAYAGKDEYMLNVSFDSNSGDETVKANIITDFDSTGNPIITQEVITAENGYLMSQQAARYYALNFFETVMQNSNNFSTKIEGTLSHLETQAEYVFSALEGSPIGMIIEGSYWYNEAESSLQASANAYPEDGVDRNFSFMPLPRELTGQVQEGQGKKNTLLDTLNSYVYINAKVQENPVVEEVAKKFVQFCYTDAELMNFTSETSVFKGVKYNVEKETFSGLSKYASNLYDIRSSSDIIHPYSDSKIFVNAQTKFNYNAISNCWESTIGSTAYAYPVNAFRAGKTAEDYFKGMWISQSSWNDSYSKYF